ncbi:DUF4214 domain-containing protein [Undibacterium sp. TJN19]|uniref:DUF4214 domain-containing protein n=1 Tax=Undibacterium sp. TJN19 TaxID=3413055 RepID=UPI003BF22F30
MGINASTIQKLYIAYFNRPADVAGLQYWEGQLDAKKISLVSLAQSFSEQVEYKTMYGGKNTSDVVTALYKNLFGRSPDADGLKYWAGQIDGGMVNLGTAALAIVNGATPQSLDGATIDNKLTFAAGFTASLDTATKAGSYSSASTFEVMRSILSGVTATGSLPTLTASKQVKIADAANGINKIEKLAGIDVVVDLTGVQTYTGYKVELMNGDNSFSTPVTHVLTTDEANTHKAVITIPGGSNWGDDGYKFIGVKVTDIFGNTGSVGGQLGVVLDTAPPSLPSSAFYVQKWIYDPKTLSDTYKQIKIVFDSIQFNIRAGENTGGKAAIQLKGLTVATDNTINATDTTLDFSFDTVLGAQLNDSYFTAPNYGGDISLVITDAAGNNLVYGFNSYKVSHTFKYVGGTPASNISIIPVGGNIVANTINSSNTNLLVRATINPLEYLFKKAILKINGREVAYDDTIFSSDTTVDFNLGSSSSAQLQSIIKNGGVVSVTMIDLNDKPVESILNPTLLTNFTSASSQHDILIFSGPVQLAADHASTSEVMALVTPVTLVGQTHQVQNLEVISA